MNGQSVIAATQDGTVYRLFDTLDYIPFLPLYPKLCFLQSGNYIILTGSPTSLPSSIAGKPVFALPHISSSVYEFSRDGVLLREVTIEIDIDDYSTIRQNHNRDIIFISNRALIILEDNFSLKHIVPLAERGVVAPCMNSRGDLLFGHEQTIDLLRSNGEFIKTVYTTQKDEQIANIACTGNGAAWLFYYSAEVEILNLEI